MAGNACPALLQRRRAVSYAPLVQESEVRGIRCDMSPPATITEPPLSLGGARARQLTSGDPWPDLAWSPEGWGPVLSWQQDCHSDSGSRWCQKELVGQLVQGSHGSSGRAYLGHTLVATTFRREVCRMKKNEYVPCHAALISLSRTGKKKQRGM